MTKPEFVSHTGYKVGSKRYAWCALACALMASPVELAAQSYPTKPVRVIVPFAAGGGADIMGRTISQKLTESFGQQFIVDNRAGAAANIGTEIAARAAPDGYTLIVTGPNHTINVHMFRKLSWDPVKDFEPISMLNSASYILVTHPSLPVRSLKDLIALARAKPGQLNYGSGGNGTAGHLGMELMKTMARIDMVHVPYKGGAPMLADIIGGQVLFGYDNILTSVPHIRSGRGGGLALSGAKRTPLLPELPTVAASGLPGYDIVVWQGLLAPAGTPPEIIARLQDASVAAMQMPDVRERMAKLGTDVIGGTRQEFAAFIKAELEKYGKIIRQAKIQAD